MNKKKCIIISSIISIIIVLIGIVYRISFKTNTVKKDIKSLFLIYGEDRMLYTLNEENELFKLSEEMQTPVSVRYQENFKEHAILDEKNNLIVIDKKGEKRNISSDVMMYKLDNFSKENTIYFLTNDYTLYRNVEGKNEKIDSAVVFFHTLNTNAIYYHKKDSDSEFYIKNGDKDIEKIKGKVILRADIEKSNKVYYKQDKKSYIYDLDKSTKEEFHNEDDGNIFMIEAFKDDIIYCVFQQSEDENKIGSNSLSLKYKNNDKKSIEIAKNIIDYKLSKDKKGVYYLTHNKDSEIFSLYYRAFNKDDSIKIYEDKNFKYMVAKDGAYFFNSDSILYRVEKDGKKERIAQDVQISTNEYKDSIVYTTSNDELYIGKDKIAEYVKSFYSMKDALIYITKNNEVFLVKDKKPELVIKDAKKYKKLYFAGREIYQKQFEASDLFGSWQKEDNPKVMINFEKKLMDIVTKYSKVQFKYNTTGEILGDIKIQILSDNKEMPKDYATIKNVEENRIKINGISYKKINKDEFDEAATKEKKAIDYISAMSGAKYLGLDIKCSDIFINEGKQYFLYETTDEKAPSKIIIDENGLGYNYSDWLNDKKIVEDKTFNKRYVNREENKTVQYDANRKIDMSKIKANKVDKVNPNYVNWEVALEVAVKDFFKSRGDLNEGDVSFNGELMDGSYYVEVMKDGKLVCEYEITATGGVISSKR